jgi:hypothetical protein
MKGIYLTEDGRQEIEAKIAELEMQMDKNREFASVFYGLSGRNLMLKEILSSAIILPTEESWYKVMFDGIDRDDAFDYAEKEFKDGVVIKPKQ